jgi:hypothetical protein
VTAHSGTFRGAITHQSRIYPRCLRVASGRLGLGPRARLETTSGRGPAYFQGLSRQNRCTVGPHFESLMCQTCRVSADHSPVICGEQASSGSLFGPGKARDLAGIGPGICPKAKVPRKAILPGGFISFPGPQKKFRLLRSRQCKYQNSMVRHRQTGLAK